MSLPLSINLRADQALGKDNDGAMAFAIKALNEAFRRCEIGWRTKCRISLAPGLDDASSGLSPADRDETLIMEKMICQLD